GRASPGRGRRWAPRSSLVSSNERPAALSTFSASATTSGPTPSPPITASVICDDAMRVPYGLLVARVAEVSPVVAAVQGDLDGLRGRWPVSPGGRPVGSVRGCPAAGPGPARFGGVLGDGGGPVPVIHVVH